MLHMPPINGCDAAELQADPPRFRFQLAAIQLVPSRIDESVNAFYVAYSYNA